MNNNDYLEQYYDLWVLFNHTRHAIFTARELELRKFNINTTQGRLLRIVNKLGENATPTEIGKQVFRQSHTVSSLVDRMVIKGLVKKMKDPNNKKTVIVALTEKGQEVLTLVMKIESLETIWSGLSERDRKQLEKILNILFTRAMALHKSIVG